MTGDVEEEECSLLQLGDPEQPSSTSFIHSEDTCIYTGSVSAELAENFPQGSVLQIMPDSAIVTVDVKNLPVSKENSVVFEENNFTECTNLNDPPRAVDVSEENLDIDLSFLNDAEIPESKCLNENAAEGMQPFDPLQTRSVQEQDPTDQATDVVMIDVTKPIQLYQNCLIMVNGQKCVLQHDVENGQVFAYPVTEQEKPRRRRGRPRKASLEQTDEGQDDESKAVEDTDDMSEEEKEKGLLEVINDEGTFVRRSSRKRKKTRTLRDYETGNLKQELGSDLDDFEFPDKDAESHKKKNKVPGRPKKYAPSETDLNAGMRRQRGRPKKLHHPAPVPTQAFLVQTADGEVTLMHLPVSSIPPGISLQEMAQAIALKLNLTFAQANDSAAKDLTLKNECEVALQDHSVGSTTNIPEHPVSDEVVFQSNEVSADSTSVFDPLTDHDFCLPRQEFGSKNSNRQQFALNVLETDFDQKPTERRTPPDGEMKNCIEIGNILELSNGVLEVKSSQCRDYEKMSSLQPAVVTSTSKSDNSLSVRIVSGTKLCKICQTPYLRDEEILEHFKAKHPKCICTECNYMNEHPYVIKRHALRHSNQGCVCKLCHKKYKDAYILKMHLKMVHLPPDVLYACKICDKKFTRKAHLKRHLRIHAPVKQYQCPHCHYKGCEKSDITKHLLIHEEPKFKCEICGKVFRHVKNRDLHLKRHSGQRDYKCATCGFFGYTFTDIRKHIERRHSVSCPKCKRIFSDSESLKEHKRTGLCQQIPSDQTNELKVLGNPVISKEVTFSEELPLDILDQPHGMIIGECSEETLQSGHLVMTSIEGILNTQRGNHLLHPPANRDSEKMVTANGRTPLDSGTVDHSVAVSYLMSTEPS